nr:hypothetical protein [uncultured Cetobacterium sp.]
MKKTFKLALGIFICIGTVAGIFYGTKENPRVYLNNRINLAYVNETINEKSFSDVIEFIEKSGRPIDKNVKDIIKEINGIYIVSPSNFVSRKKSIVGIVDFGYMYPIFLLKVENYFDKTDDMYLLKEKYRNKYLNGNNLFLKIDKGNFIFSRRVKDLEDIVNSEKYLDKNIIEILERERKENLGMVILNLGKSPLGGFDEFVLSGNINSDKIIFKGEIGGSNDIIKSFNAIEKDELWGKKALKRNRLYLRSSKENELRSFMFFLNYFFRNKMLENISSKIYINNNENLLGDKDSKEIFIDKKQFIYGDIDMKSPKGKVIGNIEVIGTAQKDRLKIEAQMDENTAIELLKKEN